VQILCATIDRGRLRPKIDIKGKKVAVVAGFLTDKKVLQEAGAILSEATIVSKAVICAYDFTEEEVEELGISTLLCAQLVKVPTAECSFCNPK